MHPLLTDLEQFVPGFRQGRPLVKITDEFENVLALEVAVLGDTIGGHESIRFVAQNRANLILRPD